MRRARVDLVLWTMLTRSVALRAVFLSCGDGVVLATAAKVQSAQPVLTFRATIAESRYCVADEASFVVALSLTTEYRNDGRTAVRIVPTSEGPSAASVARDAEKAQIGQFDATFGGDDFSSVRWTRLRPVVELQAGQVHKGRSTAFILVRKGKGQEDWMVDAGRWFVVFESEIRAGQVGPGIASDGETPWAKFVSSPVSIDIPAAPTLSECGQSRDGEPSR